MRRVLLLTPVLLAACVAVAPERFTGPNGHAAYYMKCSGMGRTLSQCYQKAGELCPRGYVVVGQESTAVMTGYDSSAVSRSLTVECKA